MFNNKLRELGYSQVKTGLFNNKPTLWKKQVYVKRTCSSVEFETSVREFANVMKDRRDEIAEMTKEKHSLFNWKSCIDKLIDMRYSDKNKSRSDLTEFFV